MESKLVKTLKPYICGEQPQDKKYIKLNTNENPYNVSSEVVNVIKNFDVDNFRKYSDPENSLLRDTISKKFNVDKDQIFIGNGSDEVLAFSFAAFFDESKPIAIADITYSFYNVYAQLFSKRINIMPLKEDFHFDFDLALKMEEASSGLVIANPNAPTGIFEDISKIELIVKKYRNKVVIIDEAYVDFAKDNALSLLKYENVLICRTFSKSYSLAGARCGFALGSKRIIAALKTVKNSFNSYTVNALTEQVSNQALLDEKTFHEHTSLIIQNREYLIKQLEEIGYKTLPSSTNFVFTTNGNNAKKAYMALKKMGILVRYFDVSRIQNYLRISIGTKDEVVSLIKALKGISISKL